MMGRDNDFEGKVIALTGGASGIGLIDHTLKLSQAAAQNVHSRGASIAIADVDQAALDKATEIFKGSERVLITKLDVTNRKFVDSWIASIVEKFGKLTGAANCAGIIGKHHGTRKITEIEDEQWDLLLAVNLTGMMYCLRAELQKIEDSGSIVCIASIQGVMGFANHSAYVASKHGVIGLVKSAAKEFGERNIRVNAVNPGIIETPLVAKAMALDGHVSEPMVSAIKRMGTPEEVGNLIAFLLSDESKFISGACHGIDGAWNC